jgi:hypothetical protein
MEMKKGAVGGAFFVIFSAKSSSIWPHQMRIGMMM